MKKFLLATAMSVIVFGSAQGGFQAAPDIGSSLYLVCRPPLDRNDHNPVVKTFVKLSFKNGHEVQEFTVIHELFDGTKVDRSNQYTGTVAHVPGQNEWSWSGRLDRNRRITMEARVFRNARNDGGTRKMFSTMGDQMFPFTLDAVKVKGETSSWSLSGWSWSGRRD
jgi:hypothetical protein